MALRKDAADKLFAALTEYLQPLYSRRTLAISFEMVELDAELDYKQNNIHKRIKRKNLSKS